MSGRRHRFAIPLSLAGALGACYLLGAVLGIGGAHAPAWVASWTGILTAGGAAVSLGAAWRRDSTSVGRGVYACLALATTAWAVGETVPVFSHVPVSRAAVSLSFADLFWLLALPLLATAFTRTVRLPHRVRDVVRYAIDTHVCAAALFVIGWVSVFDGLYRQSGESPGTFLMELIYPLADIVLLCAVLPFVSTVPRGWRRPLRVAYLALLTLTAADVVATVLRLDGHTAPGVPVRALRVAAYLLLGVIPWLGERSAARTSAPGRATGLPSAELLAGVAAAVAVVAVAVRAVLGPASVRPVLPIVACTAVLALIVRLFIAVGEATELRRAVDAEEEHFRALAESTGDVVVISDVDGVIRYASPGVTATYGYAPADLVGRTADDIVHPEDWPQVRRTLARLVAGTQAAVRVPARIRAEDGTWRYTESTVTRYRRPGRRDDLLITTRDRSETVALQQQVTHLTFHDGLTGLPNRAYFEERVLEVLARRQCPVRGAQHTVACVFLDLDGFTAVNDLAGHAAGDHLLCQATRRLRAAVRADDTVARWGGDEFAVLVETSADAQAAVDLAERLARAVSAEPFHVAGRDIALTASVGVAFADADLAAGELIRNADLAMARAKELGGGRVEVFAAHMHADVVRRLELVTELRRALAEQQFAIEYQPVVELATSRVTGVEALVRWWRDSVFVPPDDFIGPAEDSGLITPLGELVLRESCRQVAEWRRSSWDIGLSVNLSARQIAAPGFIETVADALRESGLPASSLTVEVTEEVLVEDADETVARLSALRELGVRLAIDDFGTGYASLAYLRQLPVDVIKIDPSFVAGLGRDDTLTLLTRTIVRFGRDLGLTVVAEGIERPEQLDLLREMGCSRGQGYLVARPMGARRIESLVRTDIGGRGRGVRSPGRTPAPAR